MKELVDQKKENKKLYSTQEKKMAAILSEIETLKEVLKMKNVEIESLITLRQQEKDKVYQNSINLDHKETEIKKLKSCLNEAKVQLKCSQSSSLNNLLCKLKVEEGMKMKEYERFKRKLELIDLEKRDELEKKSIYSSNEKYDSAIDRLVSLESRCRELQERNIMLKD